MKQIFLPTPLLSTALAIVAVLFAVGGYGLGLWQDDMPGAGLLPFGAALLMLPLILRVFFERPAEETGFNLRPLGAVLLLIVYAAVLPYLGFIIPTFLLILIWVKVFDRRPILMTAIVAAGLTLAGAFLFVTLLQVPMPLIPKIL